MHSAPAGYEYLDRESYRLLIPAPMTLEGRSDGATRVSTMGARMLVLAGDPIAVEDSNDGAMQNAFGQFLGRVLHNPWGGSFPKIKIGKHWGWQIGFYTGTLDGTAFGIVGSQTYRNIFEDHGYASTGCEPCAKRETTRVGEKKLPFKLLWFRGRAGGRR